MGQVNVGIIGFGTVGAGTVEIMDREQAAKAGLENEIAAIRMDKNKVMVNKENLNKKAGDNKQQGRFQNCCQEDRRPGPEL